MTRSDIRAWVFTLVAPFLLVAAYLLTAPPAQADVAEDAFINALDSEGITYPNRGYAINAGHILCGQLNRGASLIRVVTNLYAESELTLDQSAFMVGASIGSFCDWHADKIRPGVPA